MLVGIAVGIGASHVGNADESDNRTVDSLAREYPPAIPGQPITPHITEGYHRAFLRNMRSLGQDSSALFLAVGLSQGPLLPAKLWKRLSLSIWL